jgi:hypothetical protein
MAAHNLQLRHTAPAAQHQNPVERVVQDVKARANVLLHYASLGVGMRSLALHAAAKLHNVTPKPHSRRPLLAGGATPYEAARGAPYDNAKLRHFFGAVAAVRLNATGRPSTLERQARTALYLFPADDTAGHRFLVIESLAVVTSKHFQVSDDPDRLPRAALAHRDLLRLNHGGVRLPDAEHQAQLERVLRLPAPAGTAPADQALVISPLTRQPVGLARLSWDAPPPRRPNVEQGHPVDQLQALPALAAAAAAPRDEPWPRAAGGGSPAWEPSLPRVGEEGGAPRAARAALRQLPPDTPCALAASAPHARGSAPARRHHGAAGARSVGDYLARGGARAELPRAWAADRLALPPAVASRLLPPVFAALVPRAGGLQTVTELVDAATSEYLKARLPQRMELERGPAAREAPDLRPKLTVGTACKRTDWGLFHAAIKKEMGMLAGRGAIEQDTMAGATAWAKRRGLPLRVINSVCVLSIKPNGKYKARCTAADTRASSPTPHALVSSPTASWDGIRLTLAVAAEYGLTARFYDIVQAYLTGEDKRPVDAVALRPYGGFDRVCAGESDPFYRLRDDNGRQLVWLCTGNLYGLRRAGRVFYEHVTGWLAEHGWTATTGDPCVFVRYTGDGSRPTLLLLFVDDMALFAPDDAAVRLFDAEFEEAFGAPSTTEPPPGEAHSFLGVELRQSEDAHEIRMSIMPHVMDNLVHAVGDNVLPPPPRTITFGSYLRVIQAPVAPDNPLVPPAVVDYGKVLGVMVFLTHVAFPTEAFATAALSSAKPTLAACRALLRAASFFIAHRHDAMVFKGGPGPPSSLRLRAYSDASYDDGVGARSTGAGLVFLNGNLIAWKAGRTNRVALSTRDAESAAATHVTKLVIGFQIMLNDLKLVKVAGAQPLVLTDSLPTVQNSQADRVASASRHLSREIHFLRELVKDQLVRLQHTPASLNLADALTKHLPFPALDPIRRTCMNL